ncbi:hypothetical protein ACU8KH_05000 [Lachancea thermotolerans]
MIKQKSLPTTLLLPTSLIPVTTVSHRNAGQKSAQVTSFARRRPLISHCDLQAKSFHRMEPGATTSISCEHLVANTISSLGKQHQVQKEEAISLLRAPIAASDLLNWVAAI